MTQEDKKLLFKDLCARLPYGVIIHNEEGYEGHLNAINLTIFGIELGVNITATRRVDFQLDTCKPYLRPMSSMTEEEREDWHRQSKVDYDCEFKPEPTLSLEHCHLSVDWLNKYGFDYRGLITMGLALEAREGMYQSVEYSS